MVFFHLPLVYCFDLTRTLCASKTEQDTVSIKRTIWLKKEDYFLDGKHCKYVVDSDVFAMMRRDRESLLGSVFLSPPFQQIRCRFSP